MASVENDISKETLAIANVMGRIERLQKVLAGADRYQGPTACASPSGIASRKPSTDVTTRSQIVVHRP